MSKQAHRATVTGTAGRQRSGRRRGHARRSGSPVAAPRQDRACPRSPALANGGLPRTSIRGPGPSTDVSGAGPNV